jgi:mono/diheme cytochrome c family protein
MIPDRPLIDLPARDPGLPRVASLAVVIALGAALWLLLRPVAVALPAAEAPGAVPTEVGQTGAEVFISAGCSACHPTTGPSAPSGPSLAGVLERAQARIAAPDYAGRVDSARAYLREATLDHCLDLVPGYTCPAVPEVGLRLTAGQVDALVDFMAGLPGGSAK